MCIIEATTSYFNKKINSNESIHIKLSTVREFAKLFFPETDVSQDKVLHRNAYRHNLIQPPHGVDGWRNTGFIWEASVCVRDKHLNEVAELDLNLRSGWLSGSDLSTVSGCLLWWVKMRGGSVLIILKFCSQEPVRGLRDTSALTEHFHFSLFNTLGFPVKYLVKGFSRDLLGLRQCPTPGCHNPCATS